MDDGQLAAHRPRFVYFIRFPEKEIDSPPLLEPAAGMAVEEATAEEVPRMLPECLRDDCSVFEDVTVVVLCF